MSDKDSPAERAARLGWAAILVPLALGFVFSLVLAYQAFDASRKHQIAARATLREHAEFGAYLLASRIDQTMSETMLYAFYPIDVALGNLIDPPPPSALRVTPEASRCAPDLDAGSRTFFRYDPATGTADADGPSAAAFEAWVVRSLPPLIADLGAGAAWHQVAEPVDGRLRLIAYKRWARGGKAVVYGFESCWRSGTGSVFEEAIASTQLFPPSLIGDTPNDSLFTLAARSADGELAFGDTWTRPSSGFYGTAGLPSSSELGELELRVTLLPEAAERLVRGGIPRTSPTALGLVFLTALLLWVAVRQLRRGHELVSLRARFVRNVSHELRTPLQQILLFTELLRSDRIRDPAERNRALDVMYSETRRLIDLVGNVLRFSAPDAGKVNLREVELSELTSDTVEAFEPLARSGQARVRFETKGRVLVHADPDAARQILINLLDNAVKYGPPGQTVRVAVSRDGDRGVVTIDDEGPGIPDQDRDRVWEPFARLEGDDNGAHAGSGIGLSIVRRLSETMDGRVEIESRTEGGTRFTVSLPASVQGER